MENGHCLFIKFKMDNQLEIEIGGYEKIHLLDSYKKCVFIQNKMNEYRSNENITETAKQEASKAYLYLLASKSFLRDFMDRTGITQADIDEHMKLPF
jgi:hypothetical protein